eukprot:Rhum_TRINITY_DN11257_c0_g2::Rhum_TRINITY_DN11257_c0_g2_i1::g.43582::m.43582
MRFTLRRAALAASGAALGLGGSTAWCNGHSSHDASWSPPPAENPNYTPSSSAATAPTPAPAPAPAAAAAAAAPAIDVAALVETLRTELRHLTAEGARAVRREPQLH